MLLVLLWSVVWSSAICSAATTSKITTVKPGQATITSTQQSTANPTIANWTLWTSDRGNVFTTKYLVGIGVSVPKARFQVAGSVLFGANNQFQQALAMTSNASDSNPTATNSIYSSILGWESNTITIDSNDSSIGWWKNNIIAGDYWFIGGGVSNSINGNNSVIPWGSHNYATNNSFAAWKYANAGDENSFVWNDGSLENFGTTSPNQFLINSLHGVGINTNTTSDATLTVNGTIKGAYKAANGSIGITKKVNLKNGAGNACTMTITNGIITATTC